MILNLNLIIKLNLQTIEIFYFITIIIYSTAKQNYQILNFELNPLLPIQFQQFFILQAIYHLLFQYDFYIFFFDFLLPSLLYLINILLLCHRWSIVQLFYLFLLQLNSFHFSIFSSNFFPIHLNLFISIKVPSCFFKYLFLILCLFIFII